MRVKHQFALQFANRTFHTKGYCSDLSQTANNQIKLFRALRFSKARIAIFLAIIASAQFDYRPVGDCAKIVRQPCQHSD